MDKIWVLILNVGPTISKMSQICSKNPQKCDKIMRREILFNIKSRIHMGFHLSSEKLTLNCLDSTLEQQMQAYVTS